MGCVSHSCARRRTRSTLAHSGPCAVRAPLVDLHQPWRQFQAAEEASYFISAARRYGLPRAEALVESLLHLGDAFCQDVARRVRQGQVAALGQALSSRSTTISIIRATG
jgi:hypothetical protein